MEKLYSKMISYRETVKLFHFTCPSFAQHKASDQTLKTYDELFDKFWEYYQGIYQRLQIPIVGMSIIIRPLPVDFIVLETDELAKILEEITVTNTDILNIRDEIVGVLHQFIYLLSFK